MSSTSARRALIDRCLGGTANLLVALVAMILLACASGPTRVGVPAAGGVSLQSGPRLGWATKRIVTKLAPHTLIASDGTICRVAPERYAYTDPQALVWCEWQPAPPPGK